MAYQGFGFDADANDFGGIGSSGAGNFNSDIASQSPQKKFSGDSRVESIIPVTVRQILTCDKSPDDTFHIDGTDVQQVTLVVLITSISPQETKVSYTADDGTGAINIVKWIPTDRTENQKQDQRMKFRENTYVRVFGALRTSDSGNIHVFAYNMRAIDNFNEITYHLLECIAVHKERTKKASGGIAGPSSSSGILSMPGQSNPTGPSFAQYPRGSAPAPGLPNNDFSPAQQAVMQVIHRLVNTDVSIHDLIRECKGLSEHQIREAAEQLLDQGHIFTTLDDEHFRSIGA